MGKKQIMSEKEFDERLKAIYALPKEERSAEALKLLRESVPMSSLKKAWAVYKKMMREEQ
jgi:hypothetical protein